jgi:hypothetical protein
MFWVLTLIVVALQNMQLILEPVSETLISNQKEGKRGRNLLFFLVVSVGDLRLLFVARVFDKR